MTTGRANLRRFSAIWFVPLVAVAVVTCSFTLARAQLPFLSITGAGHPELTWSQLETEHFTIIYHNGLDSVALRAAPMAEEVYRVVTTNLRTPLTEKVKIYFSDIDEVKNAFAFDDNFIFIWMRGILDDMPFGIRSSGSAKWLRAVLTHEFTHIVVAKASKDWMSFLVPSGNVPRWFNEGLARAMEPDGFTPDLDQLLRVATVYDELNLGTDDNYFAGTMTYEAGQSFVRFLVASYGDSVIAKILHHRGGFGLYDFQEAFKSATKKPFDEVYDEWHKNLTVYYASDYGSRFETSEFGRKIPCEIPVVLAARIAPDGKRIALIGRRSSASGARLYVMANDTIGAVDLVSDEPGIEPYLSWYPDGKSVAVSKMRIGTNADVLHDLYRVDIVSGELTRLTTDGRFEEPDVAPNGDIVAVHTTQGHSDLVVIHPSGMQEQLTHYYDANVQVYTPRYSPDGKQVAYSVFSKDGVRRIAFVRTSNDTTTFLPPSEDNCRQPIWYGRGGNIAYTSVDRWGYRVHMPPPPGDVIYGTAPIAAGGIVAWDYSLLKDSLLAIGFDRRSSIPMYWISNRGRFGIRDTLTLDSKYTAWHDIHFPFVTRPEDSLAPLTHFVTSPYSSFAHVKPIVVLPIVQSDKGSDGVPGYRWGLTSVLIDPMQKHLFTLAADYGDHSHEFGGFVGYTNAELPERISVTLSDVFGFHRVLEGNAYYQRTKEGAIDVSRTFFDANSLSRSHTLLIGVRYRALTPHNNSLVNDPSGTLHSASVFDTITDPSRRPIAYRGLEFSLGYNYSSSLFHATLAVRLADVGLASDLTTSHVDLAFGYHIPFNEDRTVYLGLRGLGQAQFGAVIPQEYLGFTTNEVFEQGFSPAAITPATRLRGIRRAYYGDRLAIGSAELVFPDFLFSGLLPLVKAFEPAFVGFFDVGSVWYNSIPTNVPFVETTPIAKTTWLKSYGAELRIGAEQVLTAAFGLGYEVKSRPAPDWYFRINSGF